MKIIECPRDAMQGIKEFIPTHKKISYINQLLKVGFDTIDFGSFVSHKAIPQLRDTRQVLDGLDLSNTNSKLLSIIANVRGAHNACSYDQINCLGFPLSVSEEFQRRNTNKGINEAFSIVEEVQTLALKHNKELVVYISMAFGNPFNDNYHPDIVAELTNRLNVLEVKTIALSDTIGVSNPSNIIPLYDILIKEYPNIEFGAHFHTTIDSYEEKIEAAYENGCKRFDSALLGYGGCPMAENKLVGNVPTEKLISYFNRHLNYSNLEFTKSLELANSVFK